MPIRSLQTKIYKINIPKKEITKNNRSIKHFAIYFVDNSPFHGYKHFSFALQCNSTGMQGHFGLKLQNSKKLSRIQYVLDFVVMQMSKVNHEKGYYVTISVTHYHSAHLRQPKMSEPPYTLISDKKQAPNSLRLWKTLTGVSTLVAVAVTAVFIWYVLSHKTESGRTEQAGKNLQNALACPQLPTLFPLLKPTPERITEVFQKLESALSALVDKESSLPAISMNVFYQDEILWSGHFGSKVYKQPGKKPNDSTVYRSNWKRHQDFSCSDDVQVLRRRQNLLD